MKPYNGIRPGLLAMTALAGVSAAIALPATYASAAGFAIKEQSSSAQGNSFAGATAGAEDVSYMFFNPAGLTRHDGGQAEVVLSYIVPKSKTNDATGFGTTSSQGAGVDALVPAAYFMWSLSPDLKLGLGINAPFGLKTEYDSGWAGRAYALESEVRTTNVNPTVAYRLNDKISIGAGLQVNYADATLSRDANPGGAPVVATASADDWGFGATLGMLVEISEATRFGLGYRSRISHTLEGDFSTSPGGLVDTITADLTLPDQITAGIYHDISDQLAVMGEVGWTGWNSLDQIVNVGDNVGLIGAETYDWEDVWFSAVGVTYKASDALAIRGGIAYDQSPIPEATRGPRIPGSDRTWLSLGMNYRATPNFSIDAGYTHIFMDDSKVALNVGTAAEFTATYENSVDIITVSATLRF